MLIQIEWLVQNGRKTHRKTGSTTGAFLRTLWGKVFKNEQSKICGIQPLKK